MLFKDLKDLIFSECKLIYYGNQWLYFIRSLDENEFDDFEVIGIRYREGYIEINLKAPNKGE